MDTAILQQGPYSLLDDGTFVIDDYHRAKPFSSFLPGVAGLWGVPMWLYTVNRGQGVACFGTEDKDHALMQFESANLHHRRVATEGFRTFIRIGEGEGAAFYEPFRSRQDRYAVRNRMEIRENSLAVEETNETLGLRVRAEMFCVPGERFAALARTVTLEDLSGRSRPCEVIDGFPKIVPFYLSATLLQVLPYISEAYLRVQDLETGCVLLNNKAQSSDSPETEFVEDVHFFLGFREGANDRLLPAIVDPQRIFGDHLDWTVPHAFLQEAPFDPAAWQARHAISPSAMVYWAGSLEAGASQTLRFVTGRARNAEQARAIPAIVAQPDWFESKARRAEEEIRRIADQMFLHSDRRHLDLYAGRTFVDNSLRGGVPLTLGRPGEGKVFHVFSRRHGDLERDYNFFQLAATVFSQGNGAFRDVNQNRRNDVWINPDVADENVKYFFDLIQPDGFNPLQVRGARFHVTGRDRLARLLEAAFAPADREAVAGLLGGAFAPGEFFEALLRRGIEMRIDRQEVLDELIGMSEKLAEAEYEAGYWCDHWFYNFDLIESYLGIYPDRLRELLVGRGDYTYWDPHVRVRPRDERFVVYDAERCKQLDNIAHDSEKAALIASRPDRPRQVRLDHGRGAIHRTNLLEKILCLLANKAASFSPSGMGLEMDGGRPGWNDSVNGLPGLFGASASEVFQLKRAIAMTRAMAGGAGLDEGHRQTVPAELAELLTAVEAAIDARMAAGLDDQEAEHAYWESANTAKEAYRAATRLGFGGAMVELPWPRIARLLDRLEGRVELSIRRTIDSRTNLPSTYITHQPDEYDVLTGDDGRPRTNARGMPLIRVRRFKAHRFPLFLEAPLHALRIEDQPSAAASLHEAVRRSPLYDRQLGMYIAGDSVQDEDKDLGRIYAWPPGWFENENVFLHAEHKYLLSQLRAGLYEPFFDDFARCLICFQDIATYSRSPLENTSFIVSSRHPRPALHGRGFLSRTSGTTSEVLNLLLWMSFGFEPFGVADGRLRLQLRPRLPGWLFSREPATREILDLQGGSRTVDLPAGVFAARFLGGALVVYHNGQRRDTAGPEAVQPVASRVTWRDGGVETFDGATIDGPPAEAIRQGRATQIDVTLA